MSQKDELSSLAIFYEPGTFHYSKNKNTSLYTGWYRANPKLPNGCPCVQVRLRVSSQTKILHPFDKPQFVRVNNAFCKYYTVGHFPPVLVRFTLPAEYPDNSTPIFSLECTWILSDQLEQVVEQLNAYLNTKEKGEPCLWECFDFLEWQLIPELLGLPKNEDGSYLYDIEECVPTRVMREYALTVLVEHDFEEKRRRFRDEKMECPICAEDKLGRECTRLVGCGHLACHECMKAALEAHMDEGIMAGVFRCMHCDDVVDLSEVKEFTTPEQFKAYDNFLLQRSLALMNDIVRCPRRKCDSVCLVDNDNLARCPICQYAFCPRCLRLSHPGQSCAPAPEIPEITEPPHHKRGNKGEEEENNNENENPEDETPTFIRYEDKAIPTLEDNGMLIWRLAHESDKIKRRDLIEKITKQITSMSDVIVSRKFKDMNFNRCPTCGLFVNKFTGCNNVWCPICNKNFIFGK
ncbi:unnamed protein product [Hymenolepis diminuta]|uniref:RBR-type E3 ubiquitin transferase n=1 Tax=Hymenolepis diminuta TaxID=6216 RepID=A0A564Y4U2_HYMDI|nr:unnamed protein product [Hymenolepis diminuta]